MRGWMFGAAVIAAAPAAAASEPVVAPAPAWVRAIAIPAPNPTLAERPIQVLLVNVQRRYDKGGFDVFIEVATRVQDPQALASAGTVAIPWDPGRGALTIHKVEILRGVETIDVLAKQRLTVLRRETNLENSMLDGMLTAMLQLEGLAVGDTVRSAFTIRIDDPDALDLEPEWLSTVASGEQAGRLVQRVLWPADASVRWKASGELSQAKLNKLGGETELMLDLPDLALPEVPSDAPARFQHLGVLEMSGYDSWQAVSRAISPLFEAARRPGAGSPLEAEAQAIAAATSDPRMRAMAALRLVQDKIRYVALSMGDAGLVPAGADETWIRRFGDCKGKTSALLALLDRLGVEAEPVLVSSTLGDFLPERLPVPGAFDHVLVRARIAGKSYWLDGTRNGDRDLAALATAPFRWGLPLRAAGAALEEIPAAPAALPSLESEVVYDASRGFVLPVPYTAKLTYRGPEAAALALAFAQKGRAAMLETFKRSVGSDENHEVTAFDYSRDDDKGSLAVTYSGVRRMDWANAPGSQAQRFRFGNDTIEWRGKFERDRGPFAELPFNLPAGLHLVARETVILPGGGRGFVVEGDPIDEVAAGMHASRNVQIADGRATAYSTFRVLQPEVSAAEGRASVPRWKRINDAEAYVRTPDDYAPSSEERQAIRAAEPTTASAYVDRGYWLMDEGATKSALADFEKAAALRPDWSRPLSNRGIALAKLGRLDDAEEALRKALALNKDDFVVHQGLGVVHLERDRPAEALLAFTRALHLEPDDAYTLRRRAEAYELLGQYREALGDWERMAQLDPSQLDAVWRTARLDAQLGNQAAALARFDAAIARLPDDPYLPAGKGEYLLRFGRAAEAEAAFAAALRAIDQQIARSEKGELPELYALKATILSTAGRHDEAVAAASIGLDQFVDHIGLLATRCQVRAAGAIELSAALRDCRTAAELDPDRIFTQQARGLLALRSGDWDAAIAAYSSAIETEPRESRSLYGRGLARLRKGDKAGGEADIAKARRYGFDVAVEFDGYGLKP